MGILTYIDKWINERGSAPILRDRLAFTEKQHALEVSNLKAKLEAAEVRAQTAKVRAVNAETERDALAVKLRTMTEERDAQNKRQKDGLDWQRAAKKSSDFYEA